MGNYLKNRQLQSGSSGVVIPTGSAADRPDVPAFGLIRYNTDAGLVEFFNGTTFQSLSAGGVVTYAVDTFTGDGSDTVFTMTESVSAAAQVIVFVGSIYQTPTTAYTVSGFDITFTSAPPNTVPINVIHSST